MNNVPQHYTVGMIIDRLHELIAILLDKNAQVGQLTYEQKKRVAGTMAASIEALGGSPS